MSPRRRPVVTQLSHKGVRVGAIGANTLRKAYQNHFVFVVLAVALLAASCTSGKSRQEGDAPAETAQTRRGSTLTINGIRVEYDRNGRYSARVPAVPATD